MEYIFGFVVCAFIGGWIMDWFIPGMFKGPWPLKVGTVLFLGSIIAGIYGATELSFVLTGCFFGFFFGALALNGYRQWQEDKKRGL